MKQAKSNVAKVLLLMTLSLALIVTSFVVPSNVAEAATKKASISSTSMTIPVGTMSSKVYWNSSSWEINNAQKLSVKNAVKGATYQFTSSNTKVVKISKKGGYLTGVKAGSATITCTQTYKNKKTVVGKCKVTVKNASLKLSSYEDTYSLGKQAFNLLTYYVGYDPLYTITYRNPNATYTLTSNSKDFTIKEVKQDASKAKSLTDSKEYQTELSNYIGKKYFYGYEFNATKAGTYTVTVKETYNKKTKTVGSFQVVVKAESLYTNELELYLNDYYTANYLINYKRADENYFFEIEEYDESTISNSPVTFKEEDGTLYLVGNKAGTVDVKVRKGSETGEVIGTVKVKVIEIPCQSVSFYEDEYVTYVDDYFYFDLDVNPWDTTDKFTYTTDNPSVLKVEYDKEWNYWVIEPVGPGKATLTVTCGNSTDSCTVIVKDWDDEY